MKHFDILVTRHQGLAEYLTQEGYSWNQTLTHVSDAEVLKGKHVIGVLPIGLAAKCRTISEVQLELPAELRGKELTAEQVRQYSLGLKTYFVTEL